MNITKKEYQLRAERYNIIPVYKEYIVDTETPLSIFLKSCGQNDKGFLLESIEGARNLARYSFIGIDPKGEIQFRDGIFSLREKGKEIYSTLTAFPLKELKKLLSCYRIYKDSNLGHFLGGAVGYLGYDLVSYFENIKLPGEGLDLPEILLYLTDSLIVFDHLNNLLKIVSTVKIDKNNPPGKAYDESVELIEKIEGRISYSRISPESNGINSRQPDSSCKELTGLELARLESNFKKDDFLSAVEKAKWHITSGDAFQIVLSQRFKVKGIKDPLKIYRGLRSINPSPYMYYFNCGSFCIAGASPEPLVKIKGNSILTCPIAGTRKRGKNTAEDREATRDLLGDRKEIAEHNMLVDLARNDLGRVCRYGSIRVKKYMDVEKYSHVMHLVSRVTGSLEKGRSIFEALASVFPAGTLSGAPKIRAMQIISGLEPERRGPYGGAVGYFGYDGSLDSCIIIRTAVIKDTTAYIQAGAGIVYDSRPEEEYRETVNKAAAVINASRFLK